MTQLADLQFVGNRKAIEDLEQALCTFQPITKVRDDLKDQGGLVGKLMFLEEKIDRLSEQVDKYEQLMYDIARSVVQEHEETTTHGSIRLTTDEQFMIPLIRNEAKYIAESVLKAKLNNLHISFNG